MKGTQFSLAEIVLRRWRTFLFANTVISLLVALVYWLQPLHYTVSGLYQPQQTESLDKEAGYSSDVLEQLKLLDQWLDQWLDQFFRRDGEITPESRLIQDDEILQRTIKQLKIKDHEGNPASTLSLRRRIRLSASAEKEGAVNLAIEDVDPEKAKRIINQLMELYVERFSSESQTESENFTTVVQTHLVSAETLEKQAKQALYQMQLGTNQTPLAPVAKVGDQTLELQSIQISTKTATLND